MADLIESGKVPTVRKIPASLRFDGLNRAIVAVEENTRAVRLFLQHEPATVVAQPGELLDEVVFAHVLERREPGDLGISHTHLPWPAAAGGATLTFVEDRHGATVIRSCPCSRPAAPASLWMDASRATMCIGSPDRESKQIRWFPKRRKPLKRMGRRTTWSRLTQARVLMRRSWTLKKLQADWTCRVGASSGRFFVAAIGCQPYRRN